MFWMDPDPQSCWIRIQFWFQQYRVLPSPVSSMMLPGGKNIEYRYLFLLQSFEKPTKESTVCATKSHLFVQTRGASRCWRPGWGRRRGQRLALVCPAVVGTAIGQKIEEPGSNTKKLSGGCFADSGTKKTSAVRYAKTTLSKKNLHTACWGRYLFESSIYNLGCDPHAVIGTIVIAAQTCRNQIRLTWLPCQKREKILC